MMGSGWTIITPTLTFVIAVFPFLTQGQVIGEGGRKENTLPRITQHPEDVLVLRSSPAQMTCRAEGHPAPTIYWLKDNERLPEPTEPDDGYFFHADGTLFFLSVSGSKGPHSDVGVYQCVAENRVGTVRSHNATLEITYLRPDIRPVEASTTVAIVGSDVVFECTPPRGYPPPDIQWEKDGVTLGEDDRVEIKEDHNLMISGIRLEDAASYRCVASNKADTVRSAPSNLTVRATPSFTVVPEDIIAEPGETVLFRCEVRVEVSGDPPPTLSWRKENGDLPVGRHEQLSDGSLQIRSIQEQDAGNYICRVQKDHEVYQESATLRIGDDPAFDVLPRDQTVSLNQDVELHCQAGGNPSPEISWQDDEVDFMLFAGGSSGRFRVDNDGTLHITGIQEEDAGTYICYANSGSGNVQARAIITVIGATISPPPVISRGPFDQTLIDGSTANFKCLLLEDTADVQWTKEDEPLTIANRYSVDASNTLSISAVESTDAGRYSCIVSNSSGETSWSASLRVIENTNSEPVKLPPPAMELPESPTALQAVNVTRNSVRLTWDRPFVDTRLQTPVIGYRLEYYTPSTATGWVYLDDGIQGTSHVVTGLQPATPYVFLVRALNSKGIGTPSSVTQPIRTLDWDDQGSAIPNTVSVDITRAVPLSPTAILLHWQVSGSDMAIDGFKIKCRPSSGGGMSILETVMGVSSHIVTGLVPDEDYTVSVQPFHGQKDGQESSLEAVRTLPEGQLAPLPVPTDVVLHSKLNSCGVVVTGAYPVSPTKLQLTWKVDRHGSYINGYHVVYFPAGDFTGEKIITVIGSRSLVLTGLQPWSSYTIVVRPFHGLYRGEESEPFAGQTAEDIPRIAPSSVHASVNGSTSLIVSWTPPLRDSIDGILTGYTVFCLTNITDADQNVTVLNANSAVKRVNGLTPSAVYRVMVAAHTSAGIGPTSSPVIVQMPAVPDITGGGGDDDNSFIRKLIGILLGVLLVALLIIVALFWRKRHEKSSSITKASLHYEPTTEGVGLTLSSNLHSHHNGTQQPLPPLPTDDGSSCHGNSSLLTTFSTTNGTLSSTVGKYWPTAPLNHSQAGPAYWLLEQQDPSYSCQGMHNHATLSSGSSTMSGGHRARSPVYAVVDEEDLSQDHHCSRTLPLHQCTIVSNPAANSMPPQPYASTQLCPPQNIHYNTASRCSCGSSSNDTGCSTGTSDSQSCTNNKSTKTSKNNSEPKQGPKTKPHRKKRSKHHHAQQQQRPANTWSEMLPPPPEEPPSDRTPCVQGPPYHFHTGSSNGSMSSQHHHHPHPHHGGMEAPMQQPVTCHECMKKTHDNMTLPAMHYPSQYPPLHYNQRTFPHMDAYRGAPVNVPPGTMLDGSGGRLFQPISRPNGQYHQESGHYPQNGVPHTSENPHYPMEGGHHLAPRQVFEDPRHAEIGEELLQYNDMMSQSEAQSDNEEGQPMLANITPGIPQQAGSMPAVSELSDLEAVRGDVDTDFDGSSYCTGSILASGIGSCGEDEASEVSEGEADRFLNSHPSHQAGSLPMLTMANGIQVGSQV